MSYKKSYSRGNFDMEQTGKKSADFGLLKKTKMGDNRTIDLRSVRPGDLAVVKKEIARKKRGRKKKAVIAKAAEPLIKPIELFKKFSLSWSRNSEPLEISHPEREDILAVLEEIENADNFLKNHSWRPPIDLEMGDWPDEDIEEYLWTQEPLALQSSEPEILEGLLAEPDMAAIIESNIEITDNPTPTFSPSQREGERKRGREAENENAAAKEKLIFDQSDFLARWRQSKNQPEIVSLIPSSRKFWGKKGLEPREKTKSLAGRVAGFLTAGFLIYLVIFGLSLVGQGLLAKENILSSALQAYKSMLAAKDSAFNMNFSAAGVNFETAYQDFLTADQELNKMGRGIIYVLEKLPGGSVVGSGAALVSAGENLAKAGQSFAQIADIFLVENFGDYFSVGGPSFTQKIAQVQSEIDKAQTALAAAGQNLEQVNTGDLPADLAPQVASLKEKMPLVLQAAGQLKNWSAIFLEVLGHERAKKYLLVFQNNSEARPTGGFIGTYGVVDVDEGRLKNLFIDGIFNLDGQLYEKIIPPRPIQKISTAWSTHDANWFADWPTSAKKIMNFYEKAGGATADGVISLTPTVVEKLLALTGPIDLPEYNVSLNSDNFLDLIQYKVEIDYDKQLNQPKKILADFAPMFLAKLWQVWPQKGREIMKVLADSLAEKHILFYFSNSALENIFVGQGWAGEILSTDGDFLSVINTNINGFKTDKVIDQKIYHTASVQADGSVVDTVKITRTHHGGASQYDWYNKVNADYLRVYVPMGSKLISSRGQILEDYSAPIDYQAQGFKADSDVAAQEQGMIIDQNSGTQIFKESGKTVFGNWSFVSPGESTEIIYQYLLPFKIDFNRDSESYSLLVQKQSGSIGGEFASILQLPEQIKITWQYPENLEINGSQIKFSDNLLTDKFYGAVFGK